MFDVQYKKFNAYETVIHTLIFDPSKVVIQPCVGDPEKRQPLSEIHHTWLEDRGYTRLAGINASFFNMSATAADPIGVDMRDGGIWYGDDTDPESPLTELIQIGTQLHIGQYSKSDIERDFSTASYALSLGYPLIIDGERTASGKSQEHFQGLEDHPRTMIGQLDDGRHVWAVTDGRGSESQGLEFEEQVTFMLGLGCVQAISADGGGSSEMIINNRVVNKLDAGYERPLANGLLMYYKERPRMDLFTALGFQPTLYIGDGHGMETAGKRTPVVQEGSRQGTQVQENEFNSPTAKKLGAMAEAAGFRVVYVAPGDNEPGLTARTDLANADYEEMKAAYPYVSKSILALYISIHYNSTDMEYTWKDHKGGIEVYYWGKDGNYSTDGKRLAESVQSELITATGKYNRGAKPQHYSVIYYSKMPAILSENGFMDVWEDAKYMLDPEYQDKIALAHLKGILAYYGLDYNSYIIEETNESGDNLEDLKELVAFLQNKVEQVNDENEKLKEDLHAHKSAIGQICTIAESYK